MGVIDSLFALLFGNNRNAIKDTVEVFRENAEAGAQRSRADRSETVAQFSGEFAHQDKGAFNKFMDGVNRVPRPALALGTLGLFVSAMVDPIWFSERMQGLALVPEPLWWLLGVIVSFYFGARYQSKGQEFQKSIAATMSRVPQVVENIERLREIRHNSPGAADTRTNVQLTAAAIDPGDNRAVDDWRRA